MLRKFKQTEGADNFYIYQYHSDLRQLGFLSVLKDSWRKDLRIQTSKRFNVRRGVGVEVFGKPWTGGKMCPKVGQKVSIKASTGLGYYRSHSHTNYSI